MDSLIPVFVCLLVVITFGAFLLSVAHLLGKKPSVPPTVSKNLPYECGLKGKTDRGPVSVGFYLTAVLFILFDIEIIFLFPWAVAFGDFLSEGRGLEVLLAMILFLLIFAFGLVWEIVSGALKWK